MNPIFRLSLLSSSLLLGACEYIAIAAAPEKTSQASTAPLAERATETFWTEFHAGNYEALPDVLRLLTAAYLENPNDPDITLLLAHAHFWRATERHRLEQPDPRIIEHMSLAYQYLDYARQLRPDDERVAGWQYGAGLAIASIHADEKLKRKSYFGLKRAVADYPEFNAFSMSYPLSSLPASHERFDEAVELMWRNAEACTGEPLTRDRPDYARYMKLATYEGPKRVCWNSTIAPHNFEGFFLHFGDVLVKAGDWQTARKVYANARLSPDYGRWPYREVLESRIETAEQRAARYANADPGDDPAAMVGTAYACSGCHAGRHEPAGGLQAGG